MKLTKNSTVFSSMGEKIGSLDRVVLDPDTMNVTHLVIKKGILFSTDKIVPIHFLNDELDERITLNMNAEEIDNLSSYEEASYRSFDRRNYPDGRDDLSPDMDTVYWYPPIYLPWWTMGTMGQMVQNPKPKYVKREKNIPQGKVALEEGAKVIGRDGETLGDVEQVIIEPDEAHATHIVIGSGLITKDFKLVPTHWIRDVSDDKVYLTIHSDFFQRLPEHEMAS